jgi:DNA-binding transcriptional LysR family regulator
MTGLTELRYFLAVAKTSNVSRAAELCGISQPALSQALKRLEDAVGTQLLNRGKTGVRLTRAGERFALQSKELIEKWESLSKSVKATDQVVSGHYKLGCHVSVAIYSLPNFLRELQIKYPDLHVGLAHGLSREIANEVIEWRVDFGIVINPPRHPDLVIRELGTDEVTLWMSKDMRAPDTLIMEPSMLQTQSIVKQLEKRGMTFNRRIETASLEVIAALTESGCGVGVLPTRVAKRASSLVHFHPKSPVFKDKLCLIYRAGTQNHASGRAIVDAITHAQI